MITVTKTIQNQSVIFSFDVIRGFIQGQSSPCIRYCLNDSPWKNAERLLPDQHAVKFYTPQKIAGTKVGGVSLPMEDYAVLVAEIDAINTAIRTEKETHAEAIRTGTKSITAQWEDGEYLSGYTVYDEAARQELLRLGIAHDVSGWGTLIDAQVIDALGTTFTIPQVEAFTDPARAAQAQARATKEAKRHAKITEAQTIGQPVLLHRCSVECDGTEVECSVDLMEQWAYPDGSVREQRIHTY